MNVFNKLKKPAGKSGKRGKSGIAAKARNFIMMAAMVSVFAVSGCEKKQEAAGGAAGKPSLGSFDLMFAGATCSSPIAIALLNGYYADEGLDVTLVSGNTFETNRNLLAAGKEAVINGDFQFFPSIYNGVDIKLISSLHEGCIKIVVPKGSSIKSFADFKGKRIAVDEIGGSPMSVASIAAGSVGIDPQTEITWLPFPVDQVIQALDKGEADIAAVWDPFGTIAEETGNYTTLLDLAKDPLFKDHCCCFIFASGKVLKDNPKVVAAFVRAINHAREYIEENPEEAAKKLIESGRIATKDQDLVVKLLKSYNFGKRLADTDNKLARDDALYFAGWLSKIGYLPKDLNVEQFVDNSFVDVFALAK